MRKIIDTNFLKSDKLQEFLSDPGNLVIVPDYVMMERLAGRDPKSICDQLKILAEHPNQVRFLKSTYAISGLRASSAASAPRMASYIKVRLSFVNAR
jgi:hypothetical protein